MKKVILFTLAFCLIGGSSFSQITFGPKVGLNFSKYATNYKDSDEEPPYQMRVGPAFGAVMDLVILDYLSFQPSVLFSVKGTAVDMKELSKKGNHTYDGHARDRVTYIEIPANFAGKLELGPGTAQFFIGPYFAMALVGRNYYDYTVTRQDGTVDTEKGDTKIAFTNSVSESDTEVDGVGSFQKRMDFGFDFGIGYQWNALLFNFGYSMGLVNLQPDVTYIEGYDPSDQKYSNRTIFFNVAWLFGTD